MYFSYLASLAGMASVVSSAAVQGFNYGATFTTGAAKSQADFTSEFNQAKGLVGTDGAFTSARLYTTIQAGTTNSVSEAIPAAIATNTRLLLGLWGSGGQAGFNNELAALTAAISQYGSAFVGLVDGISVGSEDLYRISPTGIENMSGVGAGPDVIANYIQQVRNAIANTDMAGKGVGHVDTWTAWVNGSNQAAINACDWIGMDAYPYFQNTIANGIDIGGQVFFDALSATQGAVGGKPVWITETGWPVSGPQMNQAVASVPNAETYWQDVACKVLGQTNTWWYTLQDALPDTPSPSFGLVGAAGGETPLFNLQCSGSSSSASSTLPATASVAPSSVAASTATAVSSPAAVSPGQSVPSESAGTSAPLPVAASSAVEASSAPAPASSGAVVSVPAATVTEMTTFTTTTECPVTLTSGNAVSTIMSTSTMIVTSCKDGCAAPTSAAAPQPAPPSSSAAACPASLSGSYEYPHLIIPVNKDEADKAFGTSYDGEFSPSVSSLFNFDIPASDAGKTCTLVFLLPEQKDLQTSSFTISGAGGIDVKGLKSPATEQTTYNSVPESTGDVGSIPSVTPGNSYVISSGSCAAGQRIGYEVSSTGGLDLKYFQDYNPSPIGLYMTVC